MDTKTSCSLPYKRGLSDGANAQKNVIYHYYILKFIVKLFTLWTTGVHMNILKLQQHLCGPHRKSDFQVAYKEQKVKFQKNLGIHVSAFIQCIILPFNVSSKYLTTKQTVK
jgi:hypothetical protein